MGDMPRAGKRAISAVAAPPTAMARSRSPKMRVKMFMPVMPRRFCIREEAKSTRAVAMLTRDMTTTP